MAAGVVFGLVERCLEQIGRVGTRLRIKSGIEADRGRGGAAVRARHFEAVAPPGGRDRNAAPVARGGNQGPVRAPPPPLFFPPTPPPPSPPPLPRLPPLFQPLPPP